MYWTIKSILTDTFSALFSCDFDDCNMASTKAVPLLTSGHQVFNLILQYGLGGGDNFLLNVTFHEFPLSQALALLG